MVLDSVFDITIPFDGKNVSILVGIEGQNDPHPGYPLEKRAEYYLSRMVSAQKGREFTGSDYGSLMKTYSIWIVLDPPLIYRNTVYRSNMKFEAVFASADIEPPVTNTFNMVFVNIGDYIEGLPDALAIGTALFSSMDKNARGKLLKEKFNIDLSDKDLERLEEMSTIGKDKYEHGYREGMQIGTEKGIEIGTEKGIEIGIDQERKSSINAIADIVMSARQEGDSLEQSIARVHIPADYRSEVEAEVRKRLV